MNIYDQPYKNLLGDVDRIDPSTRFGKNVRLGEGVVIERGCRIGNNTIIGHYCTISPGVQIAGFNNFSCFCS